MTCPNLVNECLVPVDNLYVLTDSWFCTELDEKKKNTEETRLQLKHETSFYVVT